MQVLFSKTKKNFFGAQIQSKTDLSALALQWFDEKDTVCGYAKLLRLTGAHRFPPHMDHRPGHGFHMDL